MPFETSVAPRRIAVIGAGISGLGAAHRLMRDHRVVLIEAEGRLGGHARTLVAGKRGDQPVDTGFIVYNRVNYPNMVALFGALDVPVAPSNMSFGASFEGGAFEYGLRNLGALFAQPRNIANPRYLGMLRDVLRFNARAVQVIEKADDPSMTIGQFLEVLGTGAWFRDRYILPLSGAIWSTPLEGILDFPAQAMIRFFQNHALLSHTGQHQWYTVRGGSVEYVRRIEAALRAGGAEIRMGSAVAAVRRGPEGPELRMTGGAWERFDSIVLATHSDDALALLADPSPDEARALGAIRYQPNEVVLHADAAMMPRRRAAWASWVYTEDADGPAARIPLTYWMNSLQPIPEDDPLFVTLNATARIRAEKIHDIATFRHPVYDLAALEGQAAVRALNGARDTWFCGAWMRNGFHEDGLASALEVAEAIATRAPGAVPA